jgi:hypothetical protein
MTDGALRPGVGRVALGRMVPTAATTDGALRPEVHHTAPTAAMTDGALRPGVGRTAPDRAHNSPRHHMVKVSVIYR